MPNLTIDKFGYPNASVLELDHWVLLARPQQATLGSLVLAAKSDATAYGDLPAEAFLEQARIVPSLEAGLRKLVGFEKINYLMLMMVDPNVHFHVIPRYSGNRSWQGIEFPDAGWPGPPDLKSGVALDKGNLAALAVWLGGAINLDQGTL